MDLGIKVRTITIRNRFILVSIFIWFVLGWGKYGGGGGNVMERWFGGRGIPQFNSRLIPPH